MRKTVITLATSGIFTLVGIGLHGAVTADAPLAELSGGIRNGNQQDHDKPIDYERMPLTAARALFADDEEDETADEPVEVSGG